MSKDEDMVSTGGTGLTWKQIVDAIMTKPSVSIWPVAGLALGYKSKSAAYSAARLGYIKVIEQGRKRPVPTQWLRGVLGLKTRRRPRTAEKKAIEKTATT
jgi:hypothetical protein